MACCIFLDFLGFSRQNQDFSMGYTEFSAKNFSSRFICGVGGAQWSGLPLAGGRAGCSRPKLTLISDFLQGIVVDHPVSQSPRSGAYFGCDAADPPQVAACRLGAPPSRGQGPPLSDG